MEINLVYPNSIGHLLSILPQIKEKYLIWSKKLDKDDSFRDKLQFSSKIKINLHFFESSD